MKILNFRAKNPTILAWYENSANVGLFDMSSTTTLGRSPFWEDFFFVTLCNKKNNKGSGCVKQIPMKKLDEK